MIMLSSCTRRFIAVLILAAYATLVSAFDRPALTLMDQPLRILRDLSVYKGVLGVHIQKDDIVETDAGYAQIEVSDDMLVALAPATKVYFIQFGKSGVELLVLRGWVKLNNKRSAVNGAVNILSELMSVTLENGATTIHVGEGKAEVFAEDGGQNVAQVDAHGKVGRYVKVGREQYALRLDGQTVRVLPRPSREFMASVPIAFRDPLATAPDRLKGGKVVALKLHEATYSDVAPWLRADLAVSKKLVARYRARLSDGIFRKALDDELGQSSEWKSILHPSPREKPD
jgi:hypothetical protein